MFKVNNKKKQNDVNDVVLIFLIVNLKTYFTLFSSVSIVDLEQVNVCWECVYERYFDILLTFCCYCGEIWAGKTYFILVSYIYSITFLSDIDCRADRKLFNIF